MHSRYTALVIASALVVSACAEPTVPMPSLTRSGGFASLEGEQQYVLIASSSLPTELAASVAAAGGELTRSLGPIGVALASSSNPSFVLNASKIKGIQVVVADQMIEFEEPRVGGADIEATATGPGVGDLESFRNAQWNVDAIQAPAAWDAGNIGTGARVAVLDGGIHAAHVDLDSRIDLARSVSFVPGFAFNQDVGTLWHGTHVAGIIAAEANNIGMVGVAPGATLIGVKVLHNGTGSFGWLVSALVYASTPIAQGGAGAHIINMSLGAGVVKGGANAHLVNLVGRATQFARQQGTTVIAAAGNSAIDADHTANLVFIPGQGQGVINVSATGPVGFALGATNFDRPASYTNFGQSAINLAGPGGDFALPGNALCAIARIGGGSPLVNPCWAFDMVLSTVRGSGASIGSYNWTAGTSMAAPAVSGVAALIVGKYGPLHPAQLETILRNSADDLGKSGNDDFYGRGRVNAARAVGAQ